MKKYGTARWSGDLKTGEGHVSTESGVLQDTPYGFNKRFEGAPGANPEELIGAAHASCFSMALSMILGEKGLTAEQIDTKAEVKLEQVDGGFSITGIHLIVSAKIPGAEESTFQEAAEAAKAGCPVSKALAGPKITMEASLA